jgi:hypothetical protein
LENVEYGQQCQCEALPLAARRAADGLKSDDMLEWLHLPRLDTATQGIYLRLELVISQTA